MNTWLVGHNPIGEHQIEYKDAKRLESILELGAKTFFLKARIMGGQLTLKDNKLGWSDFKWLVKEEVKREVDSRYWHSVKNMLADR